MFIFQCYTWFIQLLADAYTYHHWNIEQQANKRERESKTYRLDSNRCNITALKTFKTRSLKEIKCNSFCGWCALWVHACGTSITMCFVSLAPIAYPPIVELAVFLLQLLEQSISISACSNEPQRKTVIIEFLFRFNSIPHHHHHQLQCSKTFARMLYPSSDLIYPSISTPQTKTCVFSSSAALNTTAAVVFLPHILWKRVPAS